MSFEPQTLAHEIAAHGPVVRVLIAGHEGSSPREAGAFMLVHAEGQSGTIGGGALEYAASQRAREMLARADPHTLVERHALGPRLGQCCGGAVTLVYEWFDAARLAELEGHAENGLIARPVTVEACRRSVPPLALRRLLAAARNGATPPPAAPRLVQGWLVEPVSQLRRVLWVWGAGHVGRAIVAMAAPLPDFAITWVDTAPARFPDPAPEGVTIVPAADPAALVAHAPRGAEHLILTYSHALDLELCHRLLGHGFARAGLIGSASKWARFRARLRALGHADARIARITCPIGAPELGKHPQKIALGVVADMLSRQVGAVDSRGQAG
ncbi:xanthine dehydrogenase accessory protein XdhC [Alkalilacustris brevis]|uniref:xanthine dehydrogenase accessory protein XdhC n=1 Tax=Alkalilacustris brevis TaxID=2026338 RepID=UPI000E0D9063|nr:xanthine dehydrogenase accessory protein XdhC [Alkalilacustris brevis]